MAAKKTLRGGLVRKAGGGGGVAALALASCITMTADAAVITGTMTDVGLNDFFFNAGVFGDGTNSVEFVAGFAWWSTPLASGGMWFYGSEFSYEEGSLASRSEVAFVPGILDVSLITDASIYTYTSDAISTSVSVAGGPDMFGSQQGLVLLRNEATGHYGALRLDGMRAQPFSFDADGIDVTWWFQTDGTGDFSSVPAPATVPLLLAPALFGGRRRRR